MDKDKVLGLAKLARISISETEAESLSHEFDGILNYVGEVKKAEGETLETMPQNFPVRNVLREDTNPNEPGKYREDILNQAPQRERDYIKVKNIL